MCALLLLLLAQMSSSIFVSNNQFFSVVELRREKDGKSLNLYEIDDNSNKLIFQFAKILLTFF